MNTTSRRLCSILAGSATITLGTATVGGAHAQAAAPAPLTATPDGRAHVLFDSTTAPPHAGIARGARALPLLHPKHVFGARGGGGSPATPPPDPEVLGFAQSGEVSSGAWTQDLRLNLLSTVAYFGVNFNGDGSLVTGDFGYQSWWSAPATGLINAAHAAGDRVVLTVKAFDGATIASLTGSEQFRQNAIAGVIRELNSRGGDGVNVDFEGLNPGVAPNFVTFVSELRAALLSQMPQSAYLTVDTYATSAQGGTMFDIPRLAPYVDAFDVMAYDFFHSASSSAGPVAPLNGYWYNDTAAVADYLRLVGPSQVILGVPYYGYKWSTGGTGPNAAAIGGGTADTYAGIVSDFACAQQLTGHWDSVAAEPWATWFSPASNDPCGGNHGAWRELYYENAASLGAKYDLVNGAHLRGIGIWALGYDSGQGELWNEIASKFSVTHGTPGGVPFVSQLYADVLGRPVDPSGLAAYTGRLSGGLSRSGLALILLASGEYRGGALNGLYSLLLHRPADPGGMVAWLHHLDQGGTYETVRALMIGSPEYWAVRAGGTAAGFVDALYSDVLHRGADPGGRAWWIGRVQAGASRADVARAVVTGDEAEGDVVQQIYQTYLRRPADGGGLAAYVAALQGGRHDEQVIADIANSGEYYAYALAHQPAS